jgi:RecJ-like exonuclease
MKLLIAVAAAASLLCAADVNLGRPMTVKQPVSISALLAKPASYVGKTVQVKGKITAVCQDMGCWMDLADENDAKIRIKVEDGVIVFPKSSAGKTAIAEGKFTKLESGYQIDGIGAVIQGD